MSYSLSREAAIVFLIDAKILEEIDSTHEHKAGVLRYTRSGTHSTATSSIRFCCLRIPRSTLIRLYDNRKEYFNRDYISALYSIGLGVPKDQECAQFWHKQANGTCKCPEIKGFSKLLKSQLKETITDDYYVYSNDVLKQNRLLSNVKGKMRCAVLYKSGINGFNLHNIIVNGHVLVYNLYPTRIGIPNKIEVNVKGDVKYIARLGVLEEGGEYNMGPIEDVVKELVSVCPEDNLALAFSKQVYFDHKKTLAIDYQWRISQFKQKV